MITPLVFQCNIKFLFFLQKEILKTENRFLVFRLATSYSHRDKVPTTIGAEKLNFRVRYGNGCDLLAIAARLFNWGIIPSKLDNAEEVFCKLKFTLKMVKSSND